MKAPSPRHVSPASRSWLRLALLPAILCAALVVFVLTQADALAEAEASSSAVASARQGSIASLVNTAIRALKNHVSVDLDVFVCETAAADPTQLFCTSGAHTHARPWLPTDVALNESALAAAGPGAALSAPPLPRNVTWQDVSALCRQSVDTNVTTPQLGAGNNVTLSTTAVAAALGAVAMPATWWTELRVAAYRQLQVTGLPSAFPVSTTLDPWLTLPYIRDADAMQKARLLHTPAFLFEGRFDVLLDAHALCRIARSLGMRGPSAQAFRDKTVPLVAAAEATVLGVSPRSLATTALWSEVLAEGRRVQAETQQRAAAAKRAFEAKERRGNGVAVAAAASYLNQTDVIRHVKLVAALRRWCGAEVDSRTGGGTAAAAGPLVTSTVCNRPWATVPQLSAGLLRLQASLYSRPTSMRLHSHERLRALLPVSERVAANDDLIQGMLERNSSRVNRGFNPPATMPFAGTYLTAFNVMVTPTGALQSRVPRRYAAAVGGKRLMWHTVCEGTRPDPFPEHQADELPLHEEVVVLTHRKEANIYHWISEVLGKAGPLLDYIKANPRVKLHVGVVPNRFRAGATFRHEHLDILGLRWWSRTVTGYIRARVVHYADNHACGYPHGLWAISLRERFRTALGMPNDRLMLSDAQLEVDNGAAVVPAAAAPAAAAAVTVNVTAAAAAVAAADAPPKQVVFLRRRTSRRIINERRLIAALTQMAATARHPLNITFIDDAKLPTQRETLRAMAGADLVFGAHGAGQTNAFVARPGTCQLEVIPDAWSVLCYWRMAGILGLRYNMFVAKGDRVSPIVVRESPAVAAVRACLGIPTPPPPPVPVGVNTGLVIPQRREGAAAAMRAAGQGLQPAPPLRTKSATVTPVAGTAAAARTPTAPRASGGARDGRTLDGATAAERGAHGGSTERSSSRKAGGSKSGGR